MSDVPEDHRPRRWRRRLLGALVLLILVGFGASNLFLLTSVGPRLLSRHPERFEVRWTRGWSPFPGRVRLEGLEIVSHGSRRHLEIAADRATGWVDLSALLSRTFRAQRVRGEGLVLRSRRLGDQSAVGERFSGDATIAIDQKPVPTSRLAGEATETAQRAGWRIELRDVIIESVREIPIGERRLSGVGTLSGSLDYRVRGELSLDALDATLKGRLGGEGEPAGPELAIAAIGLSVSPYDPRQVRGRPLLQFVSGRVTVRGAAADLAFLSGFLAGAEGLVLDGAGEVDADLRLASGVLLPASRLQADLDTVSVDYRGFTARGTGRLEWAVDEVDGLPWSRLILDLHRYAVRYGDAPDSELSGGGFHLEIAAGALDLAAGPPDLELNADLPASDPGSLQAVNAYLPPAAGLSVRGGTGTVRAHASLSTASRSGSVRVGFTGQDLTMTFRDLEVAGNADLEVVASGAVPGEINADSVVLHLQQGEMRQRGRRIARRVELDLEARSSSDLRSLSGPELLAGLDGHLQLSGQIDSLGFLEPLLARARWLSITGGGRLQSELSVTGGRVDPGGRLEVEMEKLQVGYLDYRAAGQGRVAAVVAADRGAVVRATLDRFDLSRAGIEEPLLSGAGFNLSARLSMIDFAARLPPQLRAEIEVPSSTVANLRVYDAYLPRGGPFTLLDGEGTLSARFDLDTQGDTGQGEIHLHGDAMRARFEELEMEGDLDLQTHLSQAELSERRFRVAGTTLDLTQVRWSDAAPDQPPWTGHVELRDGWVQLTAPLTAEVEAALTMTDAGPILAIFGERNRLVHLLEGRLDIREITGEGHVGLSSDGATLDPFALRGAGIEADARLCLGKRQRQGILLARRGGWAVGAELQGSDRDWKLLRAARWYEQRSSQLGASICGPP